MKTVLALAVFVLLRSSDSPAQHPAMPPGMTHEEHLAQMQKDAELKQHGAAAMRFDQAKASHHFVLTAEGGRIEVAVNRREDDATRAAIRRHLREIAGDFVRGDFRKPFATHGEEPPGVRTMTERRGALTFDYADTPAGGRIRIASSDPKARAAVHEFLAYQIREHATGDPLRVQPNRRDFRIR